MKSLVFQGKILKGEGKVEESLSSIKKALDMAKIFYGTEPKSAQIINIQNALDDSYSLKIDQINNKGTDQKQNGQL